MMKIILFYCHLYSVHDMHIIDIHKNANLKKSCKFGWTGSVEMGCGMLVIRQPARRHQLLLLLGRAVATGHESLVVVVVLGIGHTATRVASLLGVAEGVPLAGVEVGHLTPRVRVPICTIGVGGVQVTLLVYPLVADFALWHC